MVQVVSGVQESKAAPTPRNFFRKRFCVDNSMRSGRHRTLQVKVCLLSVKKSTHSKIQVCEESYDARFLTHVKSFLQQLDITQLHQHISVGTFLVAHVNTMMSYRDKENTHLYNF